MHRYNIHIDSWMCVHALIDTCVHTYTQTYYKNGELFMPNTHIQTERYVCLQMCMYVYITHTFQPRIFMIVELSVYTIFRFAYIQNFTYFRKYGNLIILEILKLCKYGN